MKIIILILLLAFVCQSIQSFIFEAKNTQKSVPVATATNGNRFIVNIVEYSYVNDTKTASKFRCLGTLVSQEFVVTTASCVQRTDDVHIGIQFETIRDDTNEIGYSIRFDEIQIWSHDNYEAKDNETNNIAIIKFDPQSIATTPPLFSVFKPKSLGSLPKIADYCTIHGRNVHIANSPKDNVFVIGPSSCYGTGGKQAYCTIFDDANVDPCRVLQGAPVVCNDNQINGIVLGDAVMCVKSGSKFQLRYHSIGDFINFLNYYIVGPATTIPPETTSKPNSAATYKFYLSIFVIMLVNIMVK